MPATKDGNVIASKLANALIANVEISQLTKDVVDLLPRAQHVGRVLDSFEQCFGDGAWVGGTATLTEPAASSRTPGRGDHASRVAASARPSRQRRWRNSAHVI